MPFSRLTIATVVLAKLLVAQESSAPPDSEPQAHAQAVDGGPQTRAETIEAERTAKAATVIRPGKTNQVAAGLETFVTRGWGVWSGLQTGIHGFSANIGGLAVGSQIAVGPEYILKLGNYYHPQAIWDTYVVGAGDLSFRMQTGIEMPQLSHGRSFFNFDAYRYEYTRLLYFGPGNDSQKSNITDYSMRESAFELRGGLIFHRKLRVGLTGAFRAIAVGPGTDPSLPSSDSMYTVATARGIDRQTDFRVGGFYTEYEGRDLPGDPHGGSYWLAKFQNFSGSRRALGGFNQYNFEGQYYVPFWNRRRVIALRAKAALTTPHSGTFVPFYLEPRIGGGDDLRGYSSFRFHDQNAVVATAEYRWTIIPVLDMALFADAGKVYADADQISIGQMHTDFGFGLRVRAANTIPVRIDVGFSREGTEFWLVLANIF